MRFRLSPGDTLLLSTDGATEARERPGSPETARRLSGDEALAVAHGVDAAGTSDHLSQILSRPSGWASDDTALLALRVPPRSRPARG